MKPKEPPANDHAPDAKALKRGVKEVWQALRLERRTRGKSLASADLGQSSAVLASLAEALSALAQSSRALENAEMPPKAGRRQKRTTSEAVNSKVRGEPKRKRPKLK
ncbi:MAG: hypothetical protein M0D54_20960 [Hyphomonadaceae bacterium JAD_PAG50586_4]|nr:MAG: hypothetical protein M0D54_20960 [Hyphomonadaceae bacterium JAD_PAG50586_4]